jgi:hydroxyacylglutathione hydrolase
MESEMGILPKAGESGMVSGNLSMVRDGHVNFYVYAKGPDAVCVDSGFGGERMRAELGRLGLDPAKVTCLFLTHSDRDHTGGAGMFPNAMAYMSSDEEQMMDGRTPRFLWFGNNAPKGREISFLRDGDTVEAGGIKVRAVASPGHTPGSMSYLIDGSVLCTGDTLALKGGKAKPTIRLLNKDTALLKESIRKLARLEGITTLCTGHSGCTLDFQNAMREWR